MANVMRWRYGDTKPITVAPDANEVIEIGDVVVLDTSGAKPAGSVAYGASLAATQEAVHDIFLGVAMQASPDGSSEEIRVATGGVFEFDQAPADVALGERIGLDDNTAGDAILSQQVIAVAAGNPERSIGRCAKAASMGSRVLVAIHSTVMNDGPQAVS